MKKGGGLFMNEYEVAFEVAGPAAMFARPDTGGTPTRRLYMPRS